MTSEIDPLSTVPFLTLACQKSLLTPETARALGQEAIARGVSVAEVVREKGLLHTPDVDRLEDEANLTQTLPNYELLHVLGHGGMGIVYQARQLNLDRIVAVKTIHLKENSAADVGARFQQEAKAVAQLRHPNIVTAYDFGQHADKLFLVMELLEGETLDVLIDREGRQAEAFTWLLLRQVIGGLVHAVRHGLVHRDIKPSNLFLVEAPDGVCSVTGKLVKITDFGLAFRPDGKKLERLTQTGTPLGTPLYMAPEQLTDSTVDHRADIYALGATAFHMLAGKPPYSGKTFYELAAIKIQGELPDLGSLSGFVSKESIQLLQDVLARQPEQRVNTYEELLARIDQLPTVRDLYTSQTLPSIVPTPAPTGTPLRKRWLIPIAICLLFVSGLLGGYLIWKQGQRGQAGPPGPPKPTMVTSGWGQPLFNGTNVAPPAWYPQGGQWVATADTEGGNVLSGDGIARRVLPPLEHYMLSMGVDLHEAESVDFHFGLRRDDEQSHGVLRITAESATLGQMADDDGVFEQTDTRKFATRQRAGPVYHEVRVERHGQYWWAFYQGKKIGHLPAHPQAELAEFRLEVHGGSAHFEGLQINQLVPPES